jgi:hypothetical protein
LNQKIFGSDYDDDAEIRTAEEDNIKARNRMLGLDQQNVSTSMVQTNTGAMYAMGGYARPNAEIEHKELVQVPNGLPQATRGGQLNQMSDDTFHADGATHANGGIDTSLPEGTRIYSDQIKYNGKTIAALSKPIANKIGKLEQKAEMLKDPAINTTIERYKMQQDNLFNIQEQIKGEKEMKKTMRQFAKGGLVKYKYGYEPTEEELANANYVDPELGGNTNTLGDLTDEQIGLNYAPANMGWGYKGTGNYSAGAGTDPGNINSSSLPSYGAAATSAIGSLIQLRNINKTPAPRNIQALNAPMLDPFTKVDLTQEHVANNRDALSDRQAIMRNSGSFSTQAGNLGKIRANQLSQRGNISMREENANVNIDNAYKSASQAIRAKNTYNQQVVDQQNMENAYNYNLWKSGQQNEVTSNLTGTTANLFNNRQGYNNQLAYFYALSKGYGPTGVIGRNGLTPKRGKGGTVRTMKSLKNC